MLQQRNPDRRRGLGAGIGGLLLVGVLLGPVLVIAVFGVVVATLFYSVAAAPTGLDLGTGVAASRCDLLTPARLAAIASLPPIDEAAPSSWGEVLLDSRQYADLKAQEDPNLDPADGASVIDALAVVWCALHAAALDAGSGRAAEEVEPLTFAALGTTARTGPDVLAVALTTQVRERWEQVLALEALYAEALSVTVDGAVTAQGWTHPVPGMRKYQGNFGQWRGTYRHAGEDLSAPMGSSILAAAAGIVTHVRCSAFQGRSPCNVIIDHGVDPATGARVETWYVHMYPAGIFVRVGDVVGVGQHIADVGSNGRSTGPHLHLEVHQVGRVVDPTPFFAQRGVDLRNPAYSPAPPPPPSPGSGDGEGAVAWARTQLGVPYLLGGVGPGAYDCSGLTMRAWESAGARLPRASREQYAATTRITRAAARPGDLVFWSSNGTPEGVYHVAILSQLDDAGGARVIHAPSPGRSVEEVNLWSGDLFAFGRVGS